MTTTPAFSRAVVARADLDQLFVSLRGHGYTIVGPVRRDGAIQYDEVDSTADLPAGWMDVQEAGHYRLERRDDAALFAYTVGPASWKRFLLPPAHRLWRITRGPSGLALVPDAPDETRYAFLGVRACELAAIEVQDRVLMHGEYVDPTYRARRERLFIVAVNCGRAGGTCFCASMGTGPRCRSSFDLALTEVIDEGGHWFLAGAATQAGADVLAAVPGRAPTPEEEAAAERVSAAAEAGMGRRMDTTDLPALLRGRPEHPRWDDVADRCLACGNCTMACPTCFCTTVVDTAEIDGSAAERVRHWDSCFSIDFSYIHGGSVRTSTRGRYRQWLTHKLSTWHDQFGTSGCVGCGRCITWCPTGIDITEEVRALREPPGE